MAPLMTEEEELTVADIVARLRVSSETVRAKIRRGEFGEVRLEGNQYRVPVSNFEAYLTGTKSKRKKGKGKGQ